MNELNEIAERKQPAPRYTSRLVIMEDPVVLERLHRVALQHGHSLASEVRGALREHLDGEVER